MPVYAWDQEYATGIPSIDAQHQWMFKLVQELYDAYRSGKAKEAIPGMLTNLVSYCLTHFNDEEAQMKQHRFPALAFHREEHRQLMTRVYHLHERYANNEPDVAMEMSILLSNWLKTHIQEQDQVFAEFLRPSSPMSEECTGG